MAKMSRWQTWRARRRLARRCVKCNGPRWMHPKGWPENRRWCRNRRGTEFTPRWEN